MRKAFINLEALQYNYGQIKKMAPHSRMIAMVKSNAYGHGMVPISLALPSADAFGVACLSEAIKLRQAGIEQPIVLISGFHHSEELSALDEYQLDFVVHQPEQVEVLARYKFDYAPQIWLKINTGMNRLGFLPNQVEPAFESLSRCAWLEKPINWMMHFANSDDANAQSNRDQFNLFKQIVQDFPGEKTASNSGAIVNLPEAHLDWVRPGIMLYGISPFSEKTGIALGLKPVMTLQASLLAVHSLKKGDAIGYGSTWCCPENMPVGVISLGYGDGYPRQAGIQSAMVSIRGTLCPLIGRVSMDLMTVDLRPCLNASVGDRVVIWGEALPVEQTAATVNTLGYELVCQVSSRVEFQYGYNT